MRLRLRSRAGLPVRRVPGAMIEALLAAMIALAPAEPVARLRAVATAIASATESPIEAAVLVTISLYETNFERAGIPFGLFSWRHRMRGQPLEVCATAALRMYRFTERCGDDVATRLGWYHTGHCAPDAFSRREARTVHEVRTALGRH
jgi:hypothetical protein